MILMGKAAEFAEELGVEMTKHKIEKRELNEVEQQKFLILITLYETDKAFSTFIDFVTHLYSRCALSGHEKQFELAIEMIEVTRKLFKE